MSGWLGHHELFNPEFRALPEPIADQPAQDRQVPHRETMHTSCSLSVTARVSRGDENRQLRLGLFVVRGRGQPVTVLSLKRTFESAVIRYPRV
jgi:hypothetical protein